MFHYSPPRCAQRFAAAFVVSAIAWLGVPKASHAQLFVTASAANTLYRYDTAGNATALVTGGLLNGPRGVTFDNLGRVYVANFTARNVVRYNADGTGGIVFASTGLSGGPNDLIFDTAGNLYVANALDGVIQRFDASGAALGAFGPSISGVRSLDFDASGNLYVSGLTTPNAIFRIDPLGNATTFTTNGISGPREITFAADNTLYVVNNTANNITHYNLAGTLLGVLPTNGVSNPQGLTIGSDGTIYVVNSSSTTGQIRRYSSSGAVLSAFTVPNNQTAFGAGFAPRVLPVAAAAPEPGVLALMGTGAVPLAGTIARRRRRKA